MDDLKKLLNINIEKHVKLITPAEVNTLIPVTEKALHNVIVNRQALQNILDDRDDRLFFIVGPCSIHDVDAALEYAEKLKGLSRRVSKKLLIIMRVYFEKPRTTVGWKGFINDPRMDDSFEIEEGIKKARQLLIAINEMGLGAGTEALDPVTPQYLSELVTWAAIGARTAESQTHREIASGLSMPVGFKNGTDGSMGVAVDALQSVSRKHHFLGIDSDGVVSRFTTRGHHYAHVVLRGGSHGPNYDAASVRACEQELFKRGLRSKIVIDCSHANSNKDPVNQPAVLDDCIAQIKTGNKTIAGFMIESNLFAGSQRPGDTLQKLKYGVSVTDKCLGWGETEAMILGASEGLWG
ncbi:MAG: 3-deoxy-7-phosphoheptulonate synthase [Deltaproteobacteria bacterium]|nr:3-deoxy-7-phosphoheptulonate synthase [Deltaproteobacteria bacterium]